jgi:hypothetical protein
MATVIKSNLNHLINKAEDPEKMLDQILIQMRQQLVDAKREVAVAIADEKRLAAQLEAELEQVREWEAPVSNRGDYSMGTGRSGKSRFNPKSVPRRASVESQCLPWAL